MQYNNLKKLNTIAIYDLKAVFDAVAKDKDEALGMAGLTLAGARQAGRDTEWMTNWPPFVTARLIDNTVLSKLAEWEKSGVTHIVADAPFSDGNLTGPVENGIIEQMRKGRVKPATEDQKRAFGLS